MILWPSSYVRCYVRYERKKSNCIFVCVNTSESRWICVCMSSCQAGDTLDVCSDCVMFNWGCMSEKLYFHTCCKADCICNRNFKYLTPIRLHTSSRGAHFHISNWIIIYIRGDVLSPLIFIGYNCATFKGYRSTVASLLCGATSGYRKAVMRCMCAVHQFLGTRSFYDTHIFRGNLRQLHSPLPSYIDSHPQFDDWARESVILNCDVFCWKREDLLLAERTL